nr:hypothetical protein [Pandoravirus aubagnensis]
MTAGLQAYDLAADGGAHAKEVQSTPRDPLGECAVSAPESISRLYRKPQVHFCCTTAAMQVIEALFARCNVPHVCLATGRPDDDLAWRVATSPKGHRIMLDSRMVVQVPNTRTSTRDRRHTPADPVASAPKTITAAPNACLEPLPKDKDAKSTKTRRRRRRRRGARTVTADRVALPLSV